MPSQLFFFFFWKTKCLWKFSNIHKSGENNTIQCMHTYLSHNLNTTNTWPFFFHLLPTPLFFFFFLNWIIWKQVQNLDIIWFHIISPVNTSECISTYKAIKKYLQYHYNTYNKINNNFLVFSKTQSVFKIAQLFLRLFSTVDLFKTRSKQVSHICIASDW